MILISVSCSRREKGLKEENRKRYTKPLRKPQGELTNLTVDVKVMLIKCDCGKVVASTDGTNIYIKCNKCRRMHRLQIPS